MASWVQVGYWRTNLTLYGRALAVTEDNYVAHTNLGTALLAENRVPEALEHYRKAVRIDPTATDAHANLGGALAAGGDTAAALEAFQRALALNDQDAATHVRVAERLVRSAPSPDAERLATLAVAYEGAARLADALAVWNDAISAARAGGRTDLLPDLEAALEACRRRSPVNGTP